MWHLNSGTFLTGPYLDLNSKKGTATYLRPVNIVMLLLALKSFLTVLAIYNKRDSSFI